MLEPIPFAGMVEIDNDKSLVEQAPYHPGYEDAGFEPAKLKDLTDKEIVDIYQSSYCQSGLDEWEFNPIYFARAILRKASEK
jgi:hypothetical protein